MNQKANEKLYHSVQTIAEAYLSSYANVRSQKAVTVADDTTIRKLHSVGFSKEGRPLNAVIDEMIETVYANQAIMQHPPLFLLLSQVRLRRCPG